MANEFVVKNGLISSGSVTIQSNASGAFVGNLIGTASHATYAENINTNVTVSYADFAHSASWAPMPIVPSTDSASWASQSFSASYAQRAGYADTVGTVESASHALRADWADSFDTNVTVSYANFALSASSAPYQPSASYSDFAKSSSFSDRTISASFASRTISASFASRTISSSHAVSSTSSSYYMGQFIAGPVQGANGNTNTLNVWANQGLDSEGTASIDWRERRLTSGSNGVTTNVPWTMEGTASWATSASWAQSPVTESNGALYYGLERITMGAQRFDPTGFYHSTDYRTETTLSFDSTTMKFMITGSNFKVYSSGREYTKNSEGIVVTDMLTGSLAHFYYDPTTLALSYFLVGTWDISSGAIPIATVYWDGKQAIIGDERHGIQMDGKTQEYLHETFGPRWASGYALQHTSSNPAFIIGTGHFYDDDNGYYDNSNITTARVIWHSGSVMTTTTLIPNLWVTASGTSNLAYDTGTATASVANNRYVAYWVYGVNGYSTRILSVMGQRTDSTLNDARANNNPASLTYGTFPLDEAKLFYRIIYSGNGIVQDTTDYRQNVFGGGTYTATDHGTLTGLADDDHLQYLNINGRTGGQTVVGGITASAAGEFFLGTASYSTRAGTADSAVNATTANTALYVYPTTSSPVTDAYVVFGQWDLQNYPIPSLYTQSLKFNASSGILSSPTFQGNLTGTASWATSASWAPSTPTESSSYSNFAKSSSYADFAKSASWVTHVETISASWADFAKSSSYSDRAGYAPTVMPSSAYFSAVTASAYAVSSSVMSEQLVSYTISNADNGKCITINSGSLVTVTLATASIDPGFSAMYYQSGSGKILFLAAGGAVLRNRAGLSGSAGQYSLCSLIRVQNGDFVLGGDVA